MASTIAERIIHNSTIHYIRSRKYVPEQLQHIQYTVAFTVLYRKLQAIPALESLGSCTISFPTSEHADVRVLHILVTIQLCNSNVICKL